VRYVLSSAVIPGPGVYRYTLMPVADARVWLARCWQHSVFRNTETPPTAMPGSPLKVG
jgi:hypothetical protein